MDHNKFDASDAAVLGVESVQNLIFRTDKAELKWIERATERIGDWRSFERSVFMRWAITINALHVARDRYATHPELVLRIDTLRATPAGPERVPLDSWPGEKAAANYEASIPLIAAYGIQDLYGVLEEVIGGLHDILLEADPTSLMQGDAYRPLRRAYRERGDNREKAELFETLWAERLDRWRRNRSFEGLQNLLLSFCRKVGLKRPSWHERADIEDWARAVETIAELRHLIVHGEDKVSQKLGALAAAQPALGFTFKEGEQLNVSLTDLWIVESFIDSLLTALNLSLMELGLGKPLPKPAGR